MCRLEHAERVLIWSRWLPLPHVLVDLISRYSPVTYHVMLPLKFDVPPLYASRRVLLIHPGATFSDYNNHSHQPWQVTLHHELFSMVEFESTIPTIPDHLLPWLFRHSERISHPAHRAFLAQASEDLRTTLFAFAQLTDHPIHQDDRQLLRSEWRVPFQTWARWMHQYFSRQPRATFLDWLRPVVPIWIT